MVRWWWWDPTKLSRFRPDLLPILPRDPRPTLLPPSNPSLLEEEFRQMCLSSGVWKLITRFWNKQTHTWHCEWVTWVSMAVWELVELLLFAHFARPGPLGFSGHCYTTPSLFPYNDSWLLCVFVFRPAIWIRTFWLIESVLSTSWVLVSTQRFSQKRDTITGPPYDFN